MDPALANLGWTEDHWNRICSAVSEEAQRSRVCAQALPVVSTDDPNAIAIPSLRTTLEDQPFPFKPATKRLAVDSDPTLYLTTISINVSLRSHEVADAKLDAATVMFRRAANHIARIEDALILNGRTAPNETPKGLDAIPPVFRIRGNGVTEGLFTPPPGALASPLPVGTGDEVVVAIIDAINRLEGAGGLAPFTCLLSPALYARVHTPVQGLVMPRDRILPFLQGGLFRTSLIVGDKGCVVALSGSPVEVVVAKDISVRFLQSTTESRYVFRVSERVAVRIKEPPAICKLG